MLSINKTMGKKKFKGKLPNKIIVIPNKDKTRDEKWFPNRGIANFPSPFRMIITGGCGSGEFLPLS